MKNAIRFGQVVLLMIGIAVASGKAGFCDIFTFIDANGVMHFTNVPTASAVKYRLYFRESKEDAPTPKSAHPYHDLIAQAAKSHGLAVPLLLAVIKAESNFDPKAVSRKGAMGLMQIMPDNLESLDIRDPFNPGENIMGGARYLKQMIERFSGRLPLAIAAYNAGPDAVERYNSIPPYSETENYVRRVLKYYDYFNRRT